jgi:glycosyltransferase involved in cell wall biosynthesis
MITILLISYNQQATIARTLDSIVKLKLPDIQVVLADDCSSDGTIEVAQKFMNLLPNLKIQKTLNNLGIYGNIRNGLNYVNTKYMSIIGGDDFYCTDFVIPFLDTLINVGHKDVFIYNHYIETLEGFRYPWINYKLRYKNLMNSQIRLALSTRNSIFDTKIFKSVYYTNIANEVGVNSTCDIIYDIELANAIKSWKFLDVFCSVYTIGNGITHTQDNSISFADSLISYNYILQNSKKYNLNIWDKLFVKFMIHGISFRYSPSSYNFIMVLFYFILNSFNFYSTNNLIYNTKFLFTLNNKEWLRKYYYKLLKLTYIK